MAGTDLNLLAIPFEIRARILHLVFQGAVIPLHSSKRSTALFHGHYGQSQANRKCPQPIYNPISQIRWRHLGVLFVNHQLQGEATSLALATLTFKLDLAGLSYPYDGSCLEYIFPGANRLSRGLRHLAVHYTAVNIFCGEAEWVDDHVLNLVPKLQDVTVLCGDNALLMDALTTDIDLKQHCRDRKIGESWSGLSFCPVELAKGPPKYWHKGVRSIVEQNGWKRNIRVEFQLNGDAESSSVVAVDREWMARLELVHPEETLSARMRDSGIKLSWQVYGKHRL